MIATIYAAVRGMIHSTGVEIIYDNAVVGQIILYAKHFGM